MMKFSPQQKRLGISVVLLLAALAAAAGVTYAIYTSQVYQRAVVRNRDTEAIRFSSDKLYRVVSDDTTAKKYYCPMSQGQKTMSFTVCNYDQSKKTVVNQHRLEYEIEIQVTNRTGSVEHYTINGSKINDDGTWKQSGALAGGRRSMDTYTIKFSENDYNRVEVTVTVTPKDPSLTKNTKLYGTLIPIEYATTQGVKLSSEFTDSANAAIKAVDAYNYSVSISGGEDDVVIAWDPSQLDIDPFFLAEMRKLGGTYKKGDKESTLTIHMNSEDETASYHFQFYNHGTQKPTSWDALNVSVTRKSAE